MKKGAEDLLVLLLPLLLKFTRGVLVHVHNQARLTHGILLRVVISADLVDIEAQAWEIGGGTEREGWDECLWCVVVVGEDVEYRGEGNDKRGCGCLPVKPERDCCPRRRCVCALSCVIALPGRYPEEEIADQEPMPNFIRQRRRTYTSSFDHPGEGVKFHLWEWERRAVSEGRTSLKFFLVECFFSVYDERERFDAAII